MSSYIPLVRSLGIRAEWEVISGDLRFFKITKCLHNALQGGECSLIKKPHVQRVYRAINMTNAQAMDLEHDVFIVNDPQPAALRHYLPKAPGVWIWRCHVDSSEPDAEAWAFLRPFLEEYDACVFTMERFVPLDLKGPRIATMAPAIDAFSPKNMPLPRTLCRELLANFGLEHRRPLMVQVSRFDPWKDPFGVIQAFRLAREEVPGLQLALVGSLASDDPEGWGILATILEEARLDPDIHVFTNLTGTGNMEVNAFQTAGDVVIQKSLKEGFGLVVAEALWKGTPVVAGKAGGIPLQMAGRLANYLVTSVEECAAKAVQLLRNPELAMELGQEGREHIRRNFLMPRLIRDELRLIKSLLDGKGP